MTLHQTACNGKECFLLKGKPLTLRNNEGRNRIDDLVIINLPIQEVFAYVTDHANDKYWKPFVTESKQISAGPIGVGTLFEVVIVTLKRRIADQVEVLEYEPYHWYVYRSNSQLFAFTGQLSFSTVVSGTHIQGHVNFHAQGLWKLFTPFLAIFFRSQSKQTFARLKQIMEISEQKTA